MRIVVVGATGNVGTALLDQLRDDPEVDEIIGLARRVPQQSSQSDVRWRSADITRDDLVESFRGADAVVHLAWIIQPSRDPSRLWKVNVDGTARVLDAVAEARVPSLVVASSVGAYSPRQHLRPVDETWPTHGTATSYYARQKAYVERMLDAFEARTSDTRVVRLRPGLIFQRRAAEEQRRFFVGSLLPRAFLRPGVLPVVPHLPQVRVQAVHTEDVADAYRRAVHAEVSGAFNIAAGDPFGTEDVADLLDARLVRVPLAVARAGMGLSWRAHLIPSSSGWLDMGVSVPVMDTSRARDELDWTPRHDTRDALRAVLSGIADASGGATPTLRPGRHLDEVRTGHGRRYADDAEARSGER